MIIWFWLIGFSLCWADNSLIIDYGRSSDDEVISRFDLNLGEGDRLNFNLSHKETDFGNDVGWDYRGILGYGLIRSDNADIDPLIGLASSGRGDFLTPGFRILIRYQEWKFLGQFVYFWDSDNLNNSFLVIDEMSASRLIGKRWQAGIHFDGVTGETDNRNGIWNENNGFGRVGIFTNFRLSDSLSLGTGIYQIFSDQKETTQIGGHFQLNF